MMSSHRFLFTAAVAFIGIFFLSFPAVHEPYDAAGNDDQAYEVSGPLTVTVVLERIYLDGEISEEVKTETILAMEDFWAKYEGWQLVDQDDNQIIFQKEVDDISPLLKANGYFGLSSEGVFSIFNGKPDDASEIIHSFFQIDVGKLETRKHDELRHGIRIQSKDHYLKVIQSYKAYSSPAEVN
ncbi:BofC C-terminal domain-containing protein [Metabacillus indicus]|uniref:intercompartmental signaling factor BofC n=1 Tax=Metabacillus TaxID=2675233 RepID=UPI00069046AF|nr:MULTISPECIES: intercompartmental signaling factor BofC [Metabacillus]